MQSDTFEASDPGRVVRDEPALGTEYSLGGSPAPDLNPRQQEARDAILRSDRAEDYESVDCPCGARLGDRLLSEVDRHGIPCRNLICLACGLIRVSPRWRQERYDRFYQSEYRALYNPSLSSKTDYGREVAANPATGERARWIERVAARHGLPATPQVLELGAGAGWNLARLPTNWGRVGYDVDEEYLEIGRASFGVEMRRGMVEDALDAVSRADIVLLSHVVEHFLTPGAMLERIRRRLRPGALLLVEVPGLFRLHRSNLDPRSYLQNAHTFIFCAATLGDCCRRAGLEVLEIDQFARAVCQAGSPTPDSEPRPGLAERIIRYLRRCDTGYHHYASLRRLPVMGRPAATLWKVIYFAALGRSVSKAVR